MTSIEPREAPTRIVVIGRHAAIYEGLAGLLRQYGVRVHGIYATVAEFQRSDAVPLGARDAVPRRAPDAVPLRAPEAVTRTAPDAVLLDFDTLERNHRHELLARARLVTTPETRLILLCEDATDDALRAAVACRADGVLLKSYSPGDLCAAIGHIVAGHVVMPSGWRRTAAPDAAWLAALSPRHRDVLELLAEGLRNDEIAARLGLSPNTIKFHVRELYLRIGVRNRVEASQLHASVAASRRR